MLSEIQSTVRKLLAREGHLDPSDVDVRFSAPTAAWLAELGRPTINLYLHEIVENTTLRHTQPFTVPHGPDHALQRQPPRRIDLHFIVSAHAAHPDDAQGLLWRALHTLMRVPELPADLLPDAAVRAGVPVTGQTAQPDPERRRTGAWTGAQFPPASSFTYVLTVPLDLSEDRILPIALRREVRLRGPDGEHLTSVQSGWMLLGADGEPVREAQVRVEGIESLLRTDSLGRLVLPRPPRGPTAALVHPAGVSGGVLVTLDPAARTAVLPSV